MPSIEYSGMKVTGGKVFAIFTLLGALGGAAWTGFTFYQDYLDMKEKILRIPSLTFLVLIKKYMMKVLANGIKIKK